MSSGLDFVNLEEVWFDKSGVHFGFFVQVIDFRLVGDNVDKIAQNMVISIRNGRSEVVDEHIRLEVDKFGKVQEEKETTIDRTKVEENISSYAYVKKEKKN